MLNVLSLLGVILLSINSWSQTAVTASPTYYILNEWPGAYQEGYEITEEISLDLYQSPENPIHIGSCTLKKGRSFHPYSSQNKNDRFVVISSVKTYRAQRDWTDDLGNKHKKGDLIIQLAELSEGVCLNQNKGKSYEDSCPSMYEVWELVKSSPLQDYRMLQTTCDNGKKGWLMEKDFLNYLSSETSSTTNSSASVIPLTEDELYNRGWNLD